MYTAPFMVLVNGEPTWYEFSSDAAQRWADENDARVFDARNVEIPAEDLEALLLW